MKYIKYLILFFGSIIPNISNAHVSYVIEDSVRQNLLGLNLPYLKEALFNPFNIFLMIATLFVVIFIIYYSNKINFTKKIFNHITLKLRSYHELIPWVLRLALGISFIGAGTSGVLISPTLPELHIFSFIQVVIGFCFLAGFLILPTTLLATGLYLYALFLNPYLLGNMDVLALLLSIFIFHSARPGLDDILEISLLKFLKIKRYWLPLILRIGVGTVFIYLGFYEKLLNPMMSDLVVQNYNLTDYINVSANMWVLGAGLVEVFLGFLILIGYYTRLVSAVGIVVLSVTFFYFKESVYSHVTLFSALAILTIEGSGIISVDIFKKDDEELWKEIHQ